MGWFEMAVMLLVPFSGSILHSACGFGLSILVMSTIPYILPFQQAAVLSTLIAASNSLMMSIRERKYIQFRRVWPIIIGYQTTLYVTTQISFAQPDDLLKKCLGVMLIALGIYNMFLGDRFRIRPTARNGFLSGVIGGVGAGFFTIGGPPVAVYLMAAVTDKREYRATLNFQFFLGTASSTLVRAANGAVTPQVLGWWGVSFILILIGSRVGNKVFDRINGLTVRRITCFLIAISGVNMVIR